MYKKLDDRAIREIEKIVGAKNLTIEEEKMLDYSHDEFPLPGMSKLPEVVVKPGNAKEIAEIMKLANKEKVPVVPRGGATGLCGGCVPLFGGIVLSFENMNRVLEIDEKNSMAVVEPGVTLMDFYQKLEETELFFPPHPGDESATIGGIIATNAGGARAVKYGVVRNFIRGLEVVLPQGEIINTGGKIMKNSTGYSLLHLLIGSEGTLGIITKAIINLLPPPRAMSTLVVPYDSLHNAIKTVPAIMRGKILPMAIEFIEHDPIAVTEDLLNKKWPCQKAEAYLMIIVDGPGDEEVMKISESIGEICLENGAADVFIADNKQKQQDILDIRSNLYEGIKPKTIEILDITVPPAEIANHVDKVHEIADKYQLWLPTYGHAADGNVHTHLMKAGIKDGKLDEVEQEGWKEKYPQARKELHEDAKTRGGVISGEHGIGIAKKEYLSLTAGPREIELMKQIKRAFDPNNILNPGKVFD